MRGENIIHLKYHGGARILVVDWHTEQNDMIEDVLRREGMVPITCSTSREALDIIDTRPLDAVILEPMMPGIHGYEVLRHIRSRQVTRNLPVIVVSARETPPFAKRALRWVRTTISPSHTTFAIWRAKFASASMSDAAGAFPASSAPSKYPADAGDPVTAADVLYRLGVMESRTFQRPASLGVVAIIAFLVLPLPSSAQVSCHPNIFGGQDCTSPEGHSSSTPNVFGGYDTTFPDGSRSSSRPNIFGGEDTTTLEGTIESKPNIFGGKDYRLPSGDRIESHPNMFGGQDLRQRDEHVVECHPNIFGGDDCR